jgi:hypothetical protein
MLNIGARRVVFSLLRDTTASRASTFATQLTLYCPAPA